MCFLKFPNSGGGRLIFYSHNGVSAVAGKVISFATPAVRRSLESHPQFVLDVGDPNPAADSALTVLAGRQR